MVLLPFLILIATELLLRYFQYGGNLDLVVKKRVSNKEYYALNRSVAKRYFAQSVSSVPEAIEDDLFEIKKSKTTKRIFCLGESTMAGFPYEYSATAPSFLHDRLTTLLPGYNIEVINVGLSAVGSFVVKDFIDELMSYEPDLFIVYVGHNEFYGAYGVASSVAIKGGPWLTRLTISLLKFKTFLMLRDAYASLQKKLTPEASKQNSSLMGEMVGKQYIPYNGEVYHEAREIYRENLAAIINEAQSHSIPIMFSTLVSNIRGQAPFQGIFAEGTSEAQRDRWQELIVAGDSSTAHNNLTEAIQSYTIATRIDTLNATAFYKLGLALYTTGRYDDAKIALIRAKDLDGLRFRATEEFQYELIDLCRSQGVPLARVDSAFEMNSPQHMIGTELILEHLHPNINGYFLMAKVFCQAIAQCNLLVQPTEWNWNLDKRDAEYMEMSTVTNFDREVGRIKVELLTKRWPFNTGQTPVEFTPTNATESIVFRYLQGKIVWSDARYSLADYQASNKNYEMARKECLAIAKVLHYSYQPLLRVADYYRTEGRNEEAKAAYLRCIDAEDNPYAHFKLAIILLEEERAAEAAREIEISFALENSGLYKLPPSAAASGRYLLGVSYAKLGRIPEAKRSLERALAINPNDNDAKQLLQQLGQ